MSIKIERPSIRSIIVTNHAIKRFQRRFHEMAAITCSTRGLIRKLIRDSGKPELIKRSDIGNTYIYRNGPAQFHCKKVNNTMRVITVIKEYR